MTGSSGVGSKFSGQAALTTRLMLYSLVAIVLMAMDHRGQYVPRLRGWANYLVEPIYHAVDWPVQALRGAFAFFQNTHALLRENDRLHQRLLGQQGGLQRLDTMREENRRLRALLDGAQALQHEFQFAELIAVDLDPFAHKVVIDRGRDRGVTPGQAVIDGHGVMGQVEDVQQHFATVRLISDPNHALPVQINRTGLRTVAFGTGDTSRLDLPSVPREADVRKGDVVVTSGLGDRFPAGYPVALIERIDRREGQMFAAVEARPLAALDRGREVLLIRPIEPAPDAPAAAKAADDAGQPASEVPAGAEAVNDAGRPASEVPAGAEAVDDDADDAGQSAPALEPGGAETLPSADTEDAETEDADAEPPPRPADAAEREGT